MWASWNRDIGVCRGEEWQTPTYICSLAMHANGVSYHLGPERFVQVTVMHSGVLFSSFINCASNCPVCTCSCMCLTQKWVWETKLRACSASTQETSVRLQWTSFCWTPQTDSEYLCRYSQRHVKFGNFILASTCIYKYPKFTSTCIYKYPKSRKANVKHGVGTGKKWDNWAKEIVKEKARWKNQCYEREFYGEVLIRDIRKKTCRKISHLFF